MSLKSILLTSMVATAAVALSLASDPVTFETQGSLAASNIPNNGTTILYCKPGANQRSGAQFPYRKNKKIEDKIPNTTVYLNSHSGTSTIVQSDFDLIRQECSCYWLDCDELAKRFPTLKTDKYKIQMKGDAIDVSSGDFIIDFGTTYDVPPGGIPENLPANPKCKKHI